MPRMREVTRVNKCSKRNDSGTNVTPFSMPTSRIWQKLSHIQLQKVGYQYFVYLILFLLLSLVTKFILVTNIKDYQQGKSQMKMKIYFS